MSTTLCINVTMIVIVLLLVTVVAAAKNKYPSFVKKCSSCRYFLPEVNIYNNNKYLTSRCMLFVDKTIQIVEETETIIYQDYMKCSIARSTDTLCGKDALSYVNKKKK
jgi:hypothetical protein